jgi:hypothetical protein
MPFFPRSANEKSHTCMDGRGKAMTVSNMERAIGRDKIVCGREDSTQSDDICSGGSLHSIVSFSPFSCTAKVPYLLRPHLFAAGGYSAARIMTKPVSCFPFRDDLDPSVFDNISPKSPSGLLSLRPLRHQGGANGVSRSLFGSGPPGTQSFVIAH